jgi:ATP-dependent helicase YprA (DUF1998 family)
VNPLSVSREIEKAYRRYLHSTFTPRSPALRDAFHWALEQEFRLTRGPLLQASPPFERGCSLRQLVDEGVLHEGFLRLTDDIFPIDRALYAHQEIAIRKAVGARRNLVVATGTGSGKTECFLLPTLDSLLREADEGRLNDPGVRALFLYPMNALANDQLRRLRRLLAPFPEISFGRYVGETVETPKNAEADFRERYPREPRVRNELLSREAMQAGPPHILITNFAMLEYLLLRPRDSSLFDGPTGSHWRAVALDEAHVYDGADGAEIAMLFRRLRDRVVGSEPGRLQCYATSATLGRGIDDYPELLEFARALFDEPFEWRPSDPALQDIVSASRRARSGAAACYTLPPSIYGKLNTARSSDERVTRVRAVLAADAPEALPGGQTAASAEAVLASVLERDSRVLAVQARLEKGAAELGDIAELAFGSKSSTDDLIELVDAAVNARHHSDETSLLPARYHFFLRSLEGAFVCLRTDHPSGEPRLLLAPHDACPSCAREGRPSAMFELGTCRRCGAEYVVGLQRGSQVVQAPPFARLTYLLLGDAVAVEDEDELDPGPDGDEAEARRFLCPGCGLVGDAADFSCSCDPVGRPPTRSQVTLVKPAKGSNVVRRCGACAGRTGGEIITRFTPGADAPVSVVATGIYQQLPPSADLSMADEVGEGRKLLVFADSRQDAAFFAPYLERTYGRLVQRALILGGLSGGPADSVLRAEDLVYPMLREAERRLVVDPEGSRAANQALVRTWLLQEIVASDRRQSLEGTGLIEIAVAFPRRFEAPRPLLDLGFSPAESEDLIRLLLDTVRASAAVTVPEGVDIRDDAFAPRNREYGLRGEGSQSDVISWLPGRGSNRRLDLLRKVFATKAISADPAKLLREIWDYLSNPNGIWAATLVGYSDKRHGALWRLSHERLEFIRLTETHRPLRCQRCRQIWWRSVADVCPAYACEGVLERLTADGEIRENHYAHLYETLDPVGIAVQEHTAQWTPSAGSRIQDEFMRGRVNVLSCSTTFELGVDVGEVEAVLLRNMPPSPANYVQRAGRAGRRTTSAALVVTFAQRRNHDLAFFAHPLRMVEGVIRPPRIVVDNPTIVRRHVHSVAFAAFEREVEEHRDVGAFFQPPEGNEDAADSRFMDWLRAHPASLGEAVRRVVPRATATSVGVESWDWVEALVEESEEDPTRGWLRRAGDEVRSEIDEIRARIDEAVQQDRFGAAEGLKRQRTTLLRTSLLSFLARRNVLPKYGFPVDVVPLDLARTGDADAARLQLDRDLKMAIADYAPGAEVVAAKALWRSTGLRVQSGRDWPKRAFGVCRDCGAVRQATGDLDAECRVCGSTGLDQFLSGNFVIPVFGFVGERSASKPGDSRPGRAWSTESYFSEYQDFEPPFELVPELSRHGHLTHRRVSRQGRITVVNRGPGGRGYQLCHTCGYAQAAPNPGATSGRRSGTDHRDIRRAAGRTCSSWLQSAYLGHEYLTDVVEIRTTVPMSDQDARSGLYALLEGAAALSIKRDELDGTLHRYAVGDPRAFVVFDTVPGGAGHAQRVGQRLPEVVNAGLERVLDCECGVDTSCYSCLRSYANQPWHESLVRGAAVRILSALAGR